MKLPFDPTLLIKSSKESNKQSGIIIYGGFGVGKTTTTAKVSEYCPDVIPAEESANLKDMLWIQADVGATEGFASLNIEVPTIDIQSMLTDKADSDTPTAQDVLQAIDWTLTAAKAHILAHGTKYLVVDTVSMLDRHIVNYWSASENVPRNRKDEPDHQAKWGAVADTHFRFWKSLILLPVKVIFLCHARVNESAMAVAEQKLGKDTKRSKAKAAAVGAAGENIIVPRISGSSSEVYLANVGLQLVLHADQEIGTKKYRRTFHPYGKAGGWQSKNRYQHLLDKEEPADLRHIFNKVGVV